MIKNLFILSIALLLTAVGAKGQELTISGTVFEQKEGKAINYVPFATISYYSLDDTARLEFCTLSNKFGEYRISNLRSGKYKVKIEAPGFKTKWQAIQFEDVHRLAKENNNQVYAQIALERIKQVEIAPTNYWIKDLVQTGDETIGDLVDRLKQQLNKSGGNKPKAYRILLAGKEIDSEKYELINQAPFVEVVKGVGDKNLNKTYIELYAFSSEYRTITDGVLNIVINNNTLNRNPKKINKNYKETTDFFIKK